MRVLQGYLREDERPQVLSSVHRPKASAHVSARLCLVPASVLNLHIRHSDDTSLSAMWSHAPSGSRDGYFLTLRHGNTATHLGVSLFLGSGVETVWVSQVTPPWTPERWSQT